MGMGGTEDRKIKERRKGNGEGKEERRGEKEEVPSFSPVQLTE